MYNNVIPVIWNEDCRNSSIYRDILVGIENTAAKNRNEVRVFADPEAYLISADSSEPVIVVGYETQTLYPELQQLTQAGCRVILAGLDGERFGDAISYITPSRRQATAQLVEYLRICKRERIALVGCGAGSYNDRMRIEVLKDVFYHSDNVTTQNSVFFFHKKIEESFAAFYQHHREFDAVICPNDYTALCFLRYCQNNGISIPEQLYLASFSNRLVGRYCVPGITTMSIDFQQVGTYTVLAWDFLRQHKNECTQMQMVVPSFLIIRESTGNEQHSLKDVRQLVCGSSLQGEPFYSDQMISAVMKIENCFANCDELDLRIVHYLLAGESYSAICELLYVSQSALNYRLKKIYASSGTGGRKKFEMLLKQYFTSENKLKK